MICRGQALGSLLKLTDRKEKPSVSKAVIQGAVCHASFNCCIKVLCIDSYQIGHQTGVHANATLR